MTKALKLTFPRIASTKRCVASLSFVYQIDIFKNCGPYCHFFSHSHKLAFLVSATCLKTVKCILKSEAKIAYLHVNLRVKFMPTIMKDVWKIEIVVIKLVLFYFGGGGSVGRGEEGDSVISESVILFVLLMIDSSTQRLLNKKLLKISVYLLVKKGWEYTLCRVFARYNTTFSRKSKQEIIAVIRSQEVFNEEMIRQHFPPSLWIRTTHYVS